VEGSRGEVESQEEHMGKEGVDRRGWDSLLGAEIEEVEIREVGIREEHDRGRKGRGS
jgi:hypothetical protein